jgi:glycosyltransferase involved in cell wall biosynthesis
MVGGMEKVSWALAREFSKLTDTTLITWGKSQKFLPLFLPYFLLRSFFVIPIKKITHVHLGDALLSPLGVILKIFFRVKVTTTVHGLDITYPNPAYQFVVPQCLQQLDKVICVSRATMKECMKRWVPHRKLTVIPNGVYPDEVKSNAKRTDLEKLLSLRLSDKKVLVTVGRLVRRKGVYWFIENILPKLENKYIYVVIGDGPERENINNLISKMKFEKRVLVLGKVTEADLKTIYNTSDIFIMPNIHVPGDLEGFGTVALEASCVGLPVIASNLEGIQDAVINESSGLLLDNPNLFNSAIKTFNFKSRKYISKIVCKTYSWENITNKYLDNFL